MTRLKTWSDAKIHYWFGQTQSFMHTDGILWIHNWVLIVQPSFIPNNILQKCLKPTLLTCFLPQLLQLCAEVHSQLLALLVGRLIYKNGFLVPFICGCLFSFQLLRHPPFHQEWTSFLGLILSYSKSPSDQYLEYFPTRRTILILCWSLLEITTMIFKTSSN